MEIENLCANCMREMRNPDGACEFCGFDIRTFNLPRNHMRPFSILAGKYLIGKSIGEGGFGITYIGMDLNLEVRVAIKEYYPQGFALRDNRTNDSTVWPCSENTQAFFEEGREKFINEARTIAKFRDLPEIVGVMDFFRENQTAYIVMEYLDGKTLKQYLAANGGKIPVSELLQMMQPLISSLEKLHDQNLIHRDISPDNIMIMKKGNIKILDFGGARDFVSQNGKSMSVLVKHGYAPEEQYRSHGNQGPWTDVYALCATMYRCITGEIPPDALERLHKDELKPISSFGVECPKYVEKTIMKGLSVCKEDRYQSMRELYKNLYTVQNKTEKDKEDKANKKKQINKKKNRKTKFIIFGAVAIAAIIGAATISGIGNKKKQTDETVLAKVTEIPESTEIPEPTETPVPTEIPEPTEILNSKDEVADTVIPAQTEEDINIYAADGDNTLTVWAWDQYFNIRSMQIAAKQYAEDHEGFSIDIIETSSDDCQAELAAAAEAGDYSTLPDIVLMQDNSYQKYLKNYPDAFTDLKDMNINWDDFGKLKQSYSMINDTHYGVPFDNGAVIAAYRTDILNEAGYTLADLTDITWSRFMEIGKDVHEKTGKYLLTSEVTGSDTLMMMIQSCGANVVDDDGNVFIVGNDTVEKCTNLYADLIRNDVVKLVNNWDEYISTITSGETVGVINGNWITSTLMIEEDQKGIWEITTMPKVDGVDSATNYANNGGSSWYITSNCKNVKLAEDFLASTFGSSTDFYDAILPETGAISCYLPAGESDVYNEPNEFFNGQPIFSTIVEYSSHIPEFTKTSYYYVARECVNIAVVNIVNGTSVEDALQDAQDTLAFKMTE